MKLGKLGIWTIFEEKSARESDDFAKRAEQLGYAAVWMGQPFGRDVMAHSAWLLANTSSLIVPTGIANIYARDPMTTRGGQLGLNEQSGKRFLLGIGVSHGNIVNMRGHDYGKPIETMHHYLDGMKKAMYMPPQPNEQPKTIVAALGPKMLALSRDEADGAHPYNVSPTHTAQARKILGAGKLLCVEQKLILETNADRARDAARKMLSMYLKAPNYLNNWKRMGFNDSDFENGGSDRLIDDTVAWGDEAALIKRIEEHWEAGADHVCIQTIDPNQPVGPRGLAIADEKLMANLGRLNR